MNGLSQLRKPVFSFYITTGYLCIIIPESSIINLHFRLVSIQLDKHIFPEYNRTNFDDKLTRLQAKEEPRLFFLNNPCPLFIDEVQKENSILEDIKRQVDESDERGMFILSGSQKLDLMKGMSESLV